MTEDRGTALHSFVCKPERAMGDTRLRAKDHRVLSALAKCVDNATGEAVVSQERLASLSNTRRRGVQDALARLIELGYTTMISRGRRERGQYMVRRYSIHYAPCADTGRADAVDNEPSMRPTGAHGPCALRERTAMRPTGAQLPDPLESDPSSLPDRRAAVDGKEGFGVEGKEEPSEPAEAHSEPARRAEPSQAAWQGGGAVDWEDLIARLARQGGYNQTWGDPQANPRAGERFARKDVKEACNRLGDAHRVGKRLEKMLSTKLYGGELRKAVRRLFTAEDPYASQQDLVNGAVQAVATGGDRHEAAQEAANAALNKVLARDKEGAAMLDNDDWDEAVRRETETPGIAFGLLMRRIQDKRSVVRRQNPPMAEWEKRVYAGCI